MGEGRDERVADLGERDGVRAHLVGAYALGKAQRVIAELRGRGHHDAIYIHGALERMCALYQEFGVDLTTLSAGDAERMVIDMQEALADPIFDTAPPLNDLRLAATNAPSLARAFLDLYRAHRQGQERLAALDEAIGAAGQNALSTPWEEVRDFFHYCDNYIDAVDRAAERFACPDGVRADPWQAAVSAGLSVALAVPVL